MSLDFSLKAVQKRLRLIASTLDGQTAPSVRRVILSVENTRAMILIDALRVLEHSNKLVKHYHRNVALLIVFNSASDNTTNARNIIYTS